MTAQGIGRDHERRQDVGGLLVVVAVERDDAGRARAWRWRRRRPSARRPRRSPGAPARARGRRRVRPRRGAPGRWRWARSTRPPRRPTPRRSWRCRRRSTLTSTITGIGERRRLVGERRRPVHERVARPRVAPWRGLGPNTWRWPVTFGSQAVPTNPETAVGQRRHREEPHGAVLLDRDEQQREPRDAPRGTRGASTRPQRRCVMSRTSRSSDSAVPEHSSTKSVGPGGAVPVAQLVDRRRAHHQQVRDGERSPTAMAVAAAPHAKSTWSSRVRPAA